MDMVLLVSLPELDFNSLGKYSEMQFLSHVVILLPCQYCTPLSGFLTLHQNLF